MSDKVREFCEIVHTKLETLQGRMDSLKLNIGTTWHSLQEKLKEVRQHHETSRQLLAGARSSLEKWFDQNNAEAKRTIDQVVTNRETQPLDATAQEAEECVWAAITIAEASIDDVERMILEAISARLDAEAAGHA